MGASKGLYGDKYPWLMHTIYADSAWVNVQAVCGQAGAMLGLLEPKLRGLMDAFLGASGGRMGARRVDAVS